MNDIEVSGTATVELTMEEVTDIRVAVLQRLERLAHDPDQNYAKPKRETLIRIMQKLYRVRQELRAYNANTGL